MRRRTALRGILAGTSLIGCSACLQALAAEGSGHAAAKGGAGAAPHWSYGGEAGPEHWGELSSNYAACSGTHQSPIDIATPTPAGLRELRFAYAPTPLDLVNNGHTIQANYLPGSTLEVGGVRHTLLQFHFHTPSEHAVNGKRAPMEVHLVHKRDDGMLAVVGVMLEAGAEHKGLKPVWEAMPMTADTKRRVEGQTVDATTLLPAGRGSFQYFGSLTTPPCSEGVHWIVMKDPVAVSADQIKKFQAAIPMNARPLQPVNRRFLLQSQ